MYIYFFFINLFIRNYSSCNCLFIYLFILTKCFFNKLIKNKKREHEWFKVEFPDYLKQYNEKKQIRGERYNEKVLNLLSLKSNKPLSLLSSLLFPSLSSFYFSPSSKSSLSTQSHNTNQSHKMKNGEEKREEIEPFNQPNNHSLLSNLSNRHHINEIDDHLLIEDHKYTSTPHNSHTNQNTPINNDNHGDNHNDHNDRHRVDHTDNTRDNNEDNERNEMRKQKKEENQHIHHLYLTPTGQSNNTLQLSPHPYLVAYQLLYDQNPLYSRNSSLLHLSSFVYLFI